MVCNLWYGKGSKERWGSCADAVQITMEDLQVVEHIVRKDPKVIEQCAIIGISKEDMHKVYCDRKHNGLTSWLHNMS